MTERTAFFVFFVGFLVTAFGVGGIEQSITNEALLSGVAVSVVGCLIMWAGTLGLRNAQ